MLPEPICDRCGMLDPFGFYVTSLHDGAELCGSCLDVEDGGLPECWCPVCTMHDEAEVERSRQSHPSAFVPDEVEGELVELRQAQPSESGAGGGAAGRQDCTQPPGRYRTVSRDELRDVRRSTGR